MSEPLIEKPDAPPQNAQPAAADVSGTRGWLAVTIPVALIAAFAELGLAILNNELTIFFPNGLHLNTVIMTNIMMPFFLSEVIFKGPLGVLADRWGRKPLMVIGPAISIFTPLALTVIHYPVHAIIVPLLLLYGGLRLLDGLGAAALWPAMFAYVGDNVEEGKRASAMSVLNVTYMFGLAFGFLAGGWMNDTFGPVLTGAASLRLTLHKTYRAMHRSVAHRIRSFRHFGHMGHAGPHLHLRILALRAHAAGLPVHLDRPAQFYPSFYLASVLFALATIIALVGLRNVRPRSAPETHDGAQEKMDWSSFLEAVKSVPNLMLIAFVAFLGLGCVMLLVKKFSLDEFGVSETEFGLLVLWPALLIGALAVPLGHLSDRFGKVHSVRYGLIAGAAGMWMVVGLFGIPVARDFGVLGGATLIGIGFVMVFPSWMALLTMVSRASRRGTIVGAVSTAQGAGSIIGVELGGWLYAHGSRNHHAAHILPFVASAVFLTAATVLSFAMMKPEPRPGPIAPAAEAATGA